MNAATDDGTGPWDVLRELRTLRETRLANARILGKEPNIEACLRRVLRPHDEAGFEAETDQWMIGLRGRLDRSCDELVLREIREQLGIRNQELAPEIREDLRFLFRSEAFFRYVNAYLYFGVRFLASRESDQELFGGEQIPNSTDTNVRFLRLLHPPPLSGSDLGDSRIDIVARNPPAHSFQGSGARVI